MRGSSFGSSKAWHAAYGSGAWHVGCVDCDLCESRNHSICSKCQFYASDWDKPNLNSKTGLRNKCPYSDIKCTLAYTSRKTCCNCKYYPHSKCDDYCPCCHPTIDNFTSKHEHCHCHPRRRKERKSSCWKRLKSFIKIDFHIKIG